MYPCACSQSNSHHKTAGQRLRAERAGPWSESSGAPRTRSSLSRATPPHARYRARRQGAGSHRRAVATGARASAAAPPPQQLLPQQQQQPAAPRRRGLRTHRSQKHEAAMRGANCSAAMPRNEKPHLGPLGGRKGRNWPQRQGPGGSDASRRPWAGLLGGCSWGAPRRERPRCAQHRNIATQHGPRMVYLVLTLLSGYRELAVRAAEVADFLCPPPSETRSFRWLSRRRCASTLQLVA